MIRDVKLSTLEERITTVVAYINAQRIRNIGYNVIDVGGSMNGWTYPYVNAIVDFNAPTDGGRIKHFSFNINYPDGWKTVEEYVRENGKFDFSICSHTLEDISNPKYVCDQLTKISKSGYVAVPTKYNELSRFIATPEGNLIRGNVHHRWIFSIRDNNFIGFPKVPYIEVDSIFDGLADSTKERENLGFFWDNDLVLMIINNDYLGPTQKEAMQLYREFLFNDDLDKI